VWRRPSVKLCCLLQPTRASKWSSLLLLLLLLLLQVVDGQYAFVLHTANPLTGRHGDMFGELVAGLGEVLVSNQNNSI
jgi:hypothetical protein